MADDTSTPQSLRQSMYDWIERVLGVHLLMVASGRSNEPVFSALGLGRARQQWIGARQKAVEQIARLGDALTSRFEDDAAQHATLSQAQQKLEGIVRTLDTDLETEAEALLDEEDPARQRARVQSLLSICARLKTSQTYLKFLY